MCSIHVIDFIVLFTGNYCTAKPADNHFSTIAILCYIQFDNSLTKLLAHERSDIVITVHAILRTVKVSNIHIKLRGELNTLIVNINSTGLELIVTCPVKYRLFGTLFYSRHILVEHDRCLGTCSKIKYLNEKVLYFHRSVLIGSDSEVCCCA
ncbi:MAG: hypothetical protein IJB01_10335 [Bacteroidaceae bacterium]|nr:hypothetical protein [Bacteroidaceae bacterium]